MADEELGWLRLRAREALAQTSRRGPVMGEGPVGVVRPADNRIEKSVDRQGQPALAGVFAQCHALGSARQTTVGARAAPRPLPAGHPGPAGHEILWRLPRGPRRPQRLPNPCEAGALVEGRPAAQGVSAEGRAPQHARAKQPREQWRLVLSGHHPGSLSGEELLQHQHVLEAKRARPADAPGGAGTRGAAWRRGGRRWGRWGRTLPVVYRGTNGRVRGPPRERGLRPWGGGGSPPRPVGAAARDSR